MPYLLFSTRNEADAANHKISKTVGTKGCRGVNPRCQDCVSDPSDTKYWCATVDHPTDGRAALLVLADNEQFLTTEQISTLVPSLDASWTNPS